MSKLRELLKLKIIGWILILLGSFNLINTDLSFKVGVILILVSFICETLKLDCKICKNKCKNS